MATKTSKVPPKNKVKTSKGNKTFGKIEVFIELKDSDPLDIVDFIASHFKYDDYDGEYGDYVVKGDTITNEEFRKEFDAA